MKANHSAWLYLIFMLNSRYSTPLLYRGGNSENVSADPSFLVLAAYVYRFARYKKPPRVTMYRVTRSDPEAIRGNVRLAPQLPAQPAAPKRPRPKRVPPQRQAKARQQGCV